jgi:hypothetical protein
MLSGFYLGLVSAIMGGVFGIHSGLINGASIAILAFSGAIAVYVFRKLAASTNSLIGSVLLIAGMILTILALSTGLLVLFAIGAIAGGVGLGTSFAGAVSAILPQAQPHERGELFAAIYVVSYLAFGVPAIIAGLFIAKDGLMSVAVVYAIITIAFAAASLITLLLKRARS